MLNELSITKAIRTNDCLVNTQTTRLIDNFTSFRVVTWNNQSIKFFALNLCQSSLEVCILGLEGFCCYNLTLEFLLEGIRHSFSVVTRLVVVKNDFLSFQVVSDILRNDFTLVAINKGSTEKIILLVGQVILCRTWCNEWYTRFSSICSS